MSCAVIYAALLPELALEELEAAGAAGALVVVLVELLAAAPDEAPAPASDDVAELPLSLAAGFASAAVVPGATSVVLLVPLLLLRKSVTYHPEPLS